MTVPVGGTGDLPVTVSSTVAVHVTGWLRAGPVGVQRTVVVVGSWVTLIVDGLAVLLPAWIGSPL